jgi:hypothetical protein
MLQRSQRMYFNKNLKSVFFNILIAYCYSKIRKKLKRGFSCGLLHLLAL